MWFLFISFRMLKILSSHPLLWAWGFIKRLWHIWLILLPPGRKMLQSEVIFVSPTLEALMIVWIPPRTQSGNSGFFTSAQGESVCNSKWNCFFFFFFSHRLSFWISLVLQHDHHQGQRGVRLDVWVLYSFPHSEVFWDLSGCYFWFMGSCQTKPNLNLVGRILLK